MNLIRIWKVVYKNQKLVLGVPVVEIALKSAKYISPLLILQQFSWSSCADHHRSTNRDVHVNSFTGSRQLLWEGNSSVGFATVSWCRDDLAPHRPNWKPSFHDAVQISCYLKVNWLKFDPRINYINDSRLRLIRRGSQSPSVGRLCYRRSQTQAPSSETLEAPRTCCR